MTGSRRTEAAPSRQWDFACPRTRRLAALAALAAATALAQAAPAASESVGVRVVDLSLAADEAVPRLSVARAAVTTVTFLDADGAPWPISTLHVSEGGPTAAREPSHPHVATLRADARQPAGSVVAFLEGLAEPVHLAVSRDAPAAPRIRIRIARRHREARADAVGAAVARPAPDAVEGIVREYLLANPGVLRDAMDPSRQMAAKVRDLRGEIVGRPDVPAAGDPSGAVTVVEFFDYACGFCKRSLDAMRTALARPNVRVELREYPILGEGSLRAARLALAADLQGRYLDAHEALMERPGGLDGENLPEELASALGLDAARLRTDMDSPGVAALIAANRRLAGRLGVTGTPAFLFLGPESVEVSPGALDASRMADLIASVE